MLKNLNRLARKTFERHRKTLGECRASFKNTNDLDTFCGIVWCLRILHKVAYALCVVIWAVEKNNGSKEMESIRGHVGRLNMAWLRFTIKMGYSLKINDKMLEEFQEFTRETLFAVKRLLEWAPDPVMYSGEEGWINLRCQPKLSEDRYQDKYEIFCLEKTELKATLGGAQRHMLEGLYNLCDLYNAVIKAVDQSDIAIHSCMCDEIQEEIDQTTAVSTWLINKEINDVA